MIAARRMFSFRPQTSPYQKALDWFKANLVADKGVIVHTRQPVPYPEVTGYFVPTLYECGEADLARRCVDWLVSVQLREGAFPAPDGTPYTFDTAQVMRGLCAAYERGHPVEKPLTRAGDWLLTQIDASGRLSTPSTELWGDIANDLIHTYALRPLARAGEMLGRSDYVDASRRVLSYYKAQDALVHFNRLSHFHAYAMEALRELGEVGLAARGMSEVEQVQRRDGAVPAYPGVDWVCSTGVAQYAVIWFHMGKPDRASRALDYLAKVQNKSGGFSGSYGPGARYIPGAEISWAVKYFLDAHNLMSGKVRPDA